MRYLSTLMTIANERTSTIVFRSRPTAA